jgi:hypothetical protein
MAPGPHVDGELLAHVVRPSSVPASISMDAVLIFRSSPTWVERGSNPRPTDYRTVGPDFSGCC